MPTYAVSFRVGNVGDHDKRRASIVKKIESLSSGWTWDETTSFILIKSDLSAAEVASQIYIGSDMIRDWDKVLVINVTADLYATEGTFTYPNLLASFFVPETRGVATNALAGLLQSR